MEYTCCCLFIHLKFIVQAHKKNVPLFLDAGFNLFVCVFFSFFFFLMMVNLFTSEIIIYNVLPLSRFVLV